MLTDVEIMVRPEAWHDAGKQVRIERKGAVYHADFTFEGERKGSYRSYLCERMATGIYRSRMGYNFLTEYTAYEVVHRTWPQLHRDATPEQLRAMLEDPCAEFNAYGLADSLAQVLERRRQFLEAKEPFVLLYYEMARANQQDGGMRWHKQGPYIGDKEPQCEYFKDEPEIERLVHFTFHEVRPKVTSVSP